MKVYEKPCFAELNLKTKCWVLKINGIEYNGENIEDLYNIINAQLKSLTFRVYVYHLTFFICLNGAEHFQKIKFHSVYNEENGGRIEKASCRNFDFFEAESLTGRAPSTIETSQIEYLEEFFKEQLKRYGTLTKIPMTIAQGVRDELMKIQDVKNMSYMMKFNDYDYEIYKCCRRDALYEHNEGLEDVLLEADSFDIKSCHPAIMVSEDFPDPKGRPIYVEKPKPEMLEKLLSKNMLFVLRARCKNHYEGFTSIDYAHNKKLVQELEWIDMVYYRSKAKLPDGLRNYILNQFDKKEKAKGFEKEIEKKKLNMIFGNFLMDPKAHAKQGKNPFCYKLPMQIGVWVLAYARQYLYEAVEAAGADAYYWDTDGIKCKPGVLDKWIEEDNKRRLERIQHPKLGQWVKEAERKDLIIFGLKQYWFSGTLCCSGLNGALATKWLKQEGILPYAGIVIPAQYTGRYRYDVTTDNLLQSPFTLGVGKIKEDDIYDFYRNRFSR